MKKLGGIFVLVLAVLTACDPGELPPGDPNSALGFVVRPAAVEIPSELMEPALVPIGDCVFGFGAVKVHSGNRAASWRGTEGCTRLVLEPAREPGSTFDAVAAVPGPDGSVIGLGQSFFRRDRSGEVERLFPLGPDRQATALVRAGRNLVGVGIRKVPGEERSGPVAWVSGDEGRTAREIGLPSDGPGYASPEMIAADGEQILVAGSYGADVRVWASGDAGATWTISKVVARGSGFFFKTVLRTGGKWLLAGGHAGGPLIVTGEPGDWRLEDHASMGDGRITGGTVDKAGRPVLIGDRQEQDQTASSRSCSVVWVHDGGGWQRGDLGCPAYGVSAAATLQDGRVLLASNQDLWIRP